VTEEFPRVISFETLVVDGCAPLPIQVTLEPETRDDAAEYPTAVFPLPDVSELKVWLPKPTLCNPVIPALPAPRPITIVSVAELVPALAEVPSAMELTAIAVAAPLVVPIAMVEPRFREFPFAPTMY